MSFLLITWFILAVFAVPLFISLWAIRRVKPSGYWLLFALVTFTFMATVTLTSSSYEIVRVLDIRGEDSDKLVDVLVLGEIVPTYLLIPSNPFIQPPPATPAPVSTYDSLFSIDSRTVLLRDRKTGEISVMYRGSKATLMNLFSIRTYLDSPVIWHWKWPSDLNLEVGKIYLIQVTKYNFPYYNSYYPTVMSAEELEL